MLKSFIYLFSPQKKIEDTFAITLAAKLNILRFLSLFLVVTSLASLVFRLALHPTPFSNLMGLFVICAIFSSFFFYFLKTKKVTKGAALFMVCYFLAANLRIAQGGGMYSSAIFLLVFFCVSGFVLYGKRTGRILTGLSLASILSFFVAQKMHPEVFPNPDMSLYAQGAMVLIVFLYNTLPLRYIFQEKAQLTRRLREFEKIKTSTIIMSRLTHEIGNSLNIINGNLAISKDGIHKDQYKAMFSHLSKIEKVVRSLDEKAAEGGLIEFLQEHEKEPQILSQTK